MILLPGDQTQVILLCNTASPHLDTISRTILNILDNQPYSLPRDRIYISVDSTTLKEYAGVYHLPDMILHVRVENENWWVNRKDRRPFLYWQKQKTGSL